MKHPLQNPSRRRFLKTSVLLGTLSPFAAQSIASVLQARSQAPLEVHVFSKHLQFLDYKEMAEAVAEMGFDGVDLTVRPKGHVEPERVGEDLPKAVESIRNAGLEPVMMTTAVDHPDKPADRQVLETAAGLGMKYYRMGYYRYLKDKTIPDSIAHFRDEAKSLGKLNKKLGIVGCYQNHAGNYMGASIWELWDLLSIADENYMGAQYDIRHAVADGGLSWQNGLELIRPMIQTIALKDFVWAKEDGTWKARNVPIGEGMVDFKTYFGILKRHNIQVPASLHLEYPLGGAEHGATKLTVDKRQVFEAMKRDLQKIQELWRDA